MDRLTEVIKRHPGPQQVDRAVVVKLPGKHFPQLQAAEQAVFHDGQAVEYAERHKLSVHHKAWGGAHTGPGIRFICTSDAIDDPDHATRPSAPPSARVYAVPWVLTARYALEHLPYPTLGV